MTKIKIEYGKFWSTVYLLLLLGGICYSVTRLDYFYQNHDSINCMLLIGFDILLLTFVFGIIKKYTIPALTHKAAIELNKQGIFDNIQKRFIAWDNIVEIKLATLNGNYISIQLIDASKVQSNNPFRVLFQSLNKALLSSTILISTDYLSGKDSEIINVINNYFNEIKITSEQTPGEVDTPLSNN
jgi:hypothetical protein